MWAVVDLPTPPIVMPIITYSYVNLIKKSNNEQPKFWVHLSISFLVRNASDGQVWKRAYLKDLYHRRVILGPDPLKSRAAEDNWSV